MHALMTFADLMGTTMEYIALWSILGAAWKLSEPANLVHRRKEELALQERVAGEETASPQTDEPTSKSKTMASGTTLPSLER